MAGNAQGLAEAYALFGSIPTTARDQLGIELAIIGRDLLTAERAAAPELTGALSAGLSLSLQLDQLRIRVGQHGLTGGRAKLYYGRIIEFGRKAQTVLVQRRRRVNGKLRTENGRKRASDVASVYTLRVAARPAQPFISTAGGGLDAVVTARLATFWSNVFENAGAAT